MAQGKRGQVKKGRDVRLKSLIYNPVFDKNGMLFLNGVPFYILKQFKRHWNGRPKHTGALCQGISGLCCLPVLRVRKFRCSAFHRHSGLGIFGASFFNGAPGQGFSVLCFSTALRIKDFRSSESQRSSGKILEKKSLKIKRYTAIFWCSISEF